MGGGDKKKIRGESSVTGDTPTFAKEAKPTKRFAVYGLCFLLEITERGWTSPLKYDGMKQKQHPRNQAVFGLREVSAKAPFHGELGSERHPRCLTRGGEEVARSRT